MKIILATGNRGKIKEFKSMLEEFEAVAYSDILEPFEIVEDGDTFAQNALIKAKAIFEKLPESESKNCIVLSDDSGISVPLLGGEPSIFSARYAGEGASDRENLEKLVENVRAKGVDSTDAFYTASIAIVSSLGEWVAHGWMHGKVVTTPRGDGGFGYDPIFIPDGYNQTLGELDSSIKSKISHRVKAVENVKAVVDMLEKRMKV